ncbi:MAG TPA: RNA polymerase-binding protein DksA [Gammaproteobacteria bacterium]|nr:RNA polymerase-binding protein DksA [Gammaproteobacteria bacterium]
MAKSKHGAARRSDKKAGHAAKSAKKARAAKSSAKPVHKAAPRPVAKKARPAPTAKRKSVAAKKVTKSPAVKKSSKSPAVKKSTKTSIVKKSSKSSPVKKTSSAAAAKKSKPQATKKTATSRAAKKAAVSRQSATPRAVSVPESPVVSNADVAAQESRHRSAPRKRVHQRPTSGIAARLSPGGGGGDEQTITREDGRYALPASVTIDLPKGYHPGAKEEYMSPKQLAYFRQKLKDWRDQLVEESRQTMENLREEVRDVGDDAERATRETENSLELRTRDRYRKLISKIEKALRKIEEGRYGYCEETDEEIGLERLEARPIATLSLDAQERREHLQKQMGD